MVRGIDRRRPFGVPTAGLPLRTQTALIIYHFFLFKNLIILLLCSTCYNITITIIIIRYYLFGFINLCKSSLGQHSQPRATTSTIRLRQGRLLPCSHVGDVPSLDAATILSLP